MTTFSPFTKEEDLTEEDLKRYKKKIEKEEKDGKASAEALTAADKFLQDNPNINIAHLIVHLQRKLLSTTQCCKVLGISPSAFLRLRKKYNIEPIYSLKNNELELRRSVKRIVNRGTVSQYATKNFFNETQLKSIPEDELKITQLRAARSLKFPNGINVGWKWTTRGTHPNGKLRARTDNLSKFNIKVFYFDDRDRYVVHFNGFENKFLTRQEVDKLNFKINKLKAFV